MKCFVVLLLLLVCFSALTAQTKTASPPPNFAAIAMDGTTIDTAALRGKIIVLNLWFINCPNCREEIKLLNQLVDEHKANKDVIFVGLAASRKPDIEKFLVKNPFKYRIVPSAEMIMFSKFGTPDKTGEINIPFPMHYVIDRSGNIVLKEQGIKGVDAVKAELAKQFSAKTATVK